MGVARHKFPSEDFGMGIYWFWRIFCFYNRSGFSDEDSAAIYMYMYIGNVGHNA